MSSDSSSEGARFAASERKATTNPPRREDSDVNRQNRSRRDGRSFATDNNTRSRRSGSRSPFRHRQASPRGQKRPYEDDRERHTRHSQHDSPRRIHPPSRTLRSYADIDGHEADSVNSSGRAGAPKEESERARLRSPFRHDDERQAEHQNNRDQSDRNKKLRSSFAPAAFRSNRYDSPGSDYSATPATSLSDSPTYLLEKGIILTEYDRPSGADVRVRESPEPAYTAEEVHPETPPTNVDEATLIEQRRRRREEMRLKLLKTSITQPGTPTNDGANTPGRRSESPNTDQPTTPDSMPSPASPSYSTAGSINGLANERPIDTDIQDLDSTMAADYDPSNDPEERVRLGMQNTTEVPATQYDEGCGEDRDILIPVAKPANTASTKKEDDLDMFADDNEDDMFAESIKKPETGSSLIAVPASHVKELDKSLLDQWDDADGYYKIMPGELVQGRYEIVEKLGKGMFAEVVRARDRQTNNLVAIKIIRNNETMKKAGAKELEILRKLRQHDPEDKKHIVRLESSFEHKDHLCMVFENLSLDLRALLKKVARDRGLHLTAVRFFAHQLFLALHLMKKCDILHADLKPDNILVAADEKHLKVCDLGSATDTLSNEITPYLVSRFYRAPEVILGMKADYAIDMWAIGCTLFELYTGKILFAGHSNNQMLRVIMECRGKIPKTMLIKSGFVDKYFDGPDFLSLEKGKDLLNNNKEVLRRISFLRPTKDLRTRLLSNMQGLRGAELQEFKEFESLLDRCLTLNPEKRLTPSEAFQHPFIKRAKR